MDTKLFYFLAVLGAVNALYIPGISETTNCVTKAITNGEGIVETIEDCSGQLIPPALRPLIPTIAPLRRPTTPKPSPRTAAPTKSSSAHPLPTLGPFTTTSAPKSSHASSSSARPSSTTPHPSTTTSAPKSTHASSSSASSSSTTPHPSTTTSSSSSESASSSSANPSSTTPNPSTTTSSSSSEPTSSSTASSSSSTADHSTTQSDSSTTSSRVARSIRSRRDVREVVQQLLASGDNTVLLSLGPYGNLSVILSKANLSDVNVVPLVPAPPSLDLMPTIGGLRKTLAKAREQVANVLGRAGDLQGAIQEATLNALHAFNPINALADVLSTILHIYLSLAIDLPTNIAGIVVNEGLKLVSDIIQTVVLTVWNDISMFI